MRIAHAPPTPALRAFVERYWWGEGEAGDLPLLLPGTGAELWIHWTGGVELCGANGLPPQPLPAAHLLCLRQERWSLTSRAAVGFVAVRFRAGALRHFLGTGIDDVADRVVSATDLWGPEGRRMTDEVRLATDPGARTDALDRFLTGLLAVHHRADPWMDAAVDLVYRSPGGMRVDALAERLGVGSRRLQRAFPPAVGVGPKGFQRLARFQRLTRALLLSDQRRYLPEALGAGFYDQNHFIREFRHFTGRRPTALLGQGLSHFYYEPLRGPGQAGH
ncbi:AraC family transcriptional regulator [Kitasatospora xanthocidica]|uniref:helix-turn-helix domain-containing protein n=1 Tax=Kitasatospora xanthocidica TaxID=83382 RepID=UPI001674C240|nr:helix-turn-helix domain-containing protein [Kitasatospora xanthocidica]GHF37644.1 AraC family transcriptional regulator [Kitasatospora xanthocidica]